MVIFLYWRTCCLWYQSYVIFLVVQTEDDIDMDIGVDVLLVVIVVGGVKGDVDEDDIYVGSVSEGTDFGQKKNLNQRVYWFMV